MNRQGVRDQVLEQALRRLSAEAATRLSSLLASGDQIPFDVAEDSGDDSLFYRYVPLTEAFVADRSDELRSLPAFEPACEAVTVAGVAPPFLESLGAIVPPERHERAAQMLIYFLAGLWDGRAEFSLDSRRLEQSLAELDSETRDLEAEDVLVCPLAGFEMAEPRLDLPSGVRLVRADAVDAPLEAMRSEGMGRRPWQPQFLAVVDQDAGHDGSLEALRQLRELVSVLRLFKEGGVGLGPYAFAPTGEGRWRRLATGAPAARPGSYHLSESETAELESLARALEARPDPAGELEWAMTRFEMGCERETALDGLSDHLLALRALLEGEGPIGAALPVRAAALFEDEVSEAYARDRIQRATELERALMSGRVDASREDTGTAIGIAAWIEDGLRGILRDAALGELGTDISLAADEALISAGLELGEGSPAQMGATSEWEAIPDPENFADEADVQEEQHMESERDDEITRILEPVPGEEAEIRITALPRAEGFDEGEEPGEPGTEEPERAFRVFAGEDAPDTDFEIADADARRRVVEGPEGPGGDWLSEISVEAGQTLEWPVADSSDPRPSERQRVDTPRVRHLFPVPDDAEWSVPELAYDRHSAGAGQ